MMKFERNKKYATIAFYSCVVILFAVFVVFFFLNYNDFGSYIKKILSVFTPIIYGIAIAYLLNKIVGLFERKVFSFLDKKDGKTRLKRILSVLSSYIVLVTFITAFIWIIVPQIAAGIIDLKNNMNFYILAVKNWLSSLGGGEAGGAGDGGFLNDFSDRIVEFFNGIVAQLNEFIFEQVLPKLTVFLGKFVGVLKDLVVGIVLSVYFLLQKEKLLAQVKRLFRAVLSEKRYNGFLSLAKKTDKSFGGYIVATTFDSLLVGIECFIIFSIFGIPYYPLVSLIVAVTNIIPFFGPFIGAIPSAFIIFIADPLSALVFIILIIIIQQIDGNIIAPRIIGDRIGLSAVWVVIAITIMSGFFGFTGMLFGVPIFSLIYTWVEDAIKRSLKKKNVSSDMSEYYSDEEGKEIEYEREQAEYKKEHRPPLHKRIRAFIIRRFRKKGTEEVPEDVTDGTDPEMNSDTESKPKSESEQKPESEQEPKSELEPKPGPKSESEQELKSELKQEPGPKPESEQELKSELKQEPKLKSKPSESHDNNVFSENEENAVVTDASDFSDVTGAEMGISESSVISDVVSNVVTDVDVTDDIEYELLKKEEKI